MWGGMVNRQFLQDTPGCGRLKGFIKRSRAMDTEVIEYHTDFLSIRAVDID